MTSFSIIDNSDKPFCQLFGEDGDSIQRDIIFNSQVNSGQQLPEGKWEYRRYANGAIALVCADRCFKIPVETNAGESLMVSPEAISLSANLRVLQEKAEIQDGSMIDNGLLVMHQALQEAIIRDIPSILVTSMMPAIQARKPSSPKEVRVSPHAEAHSIVLMSS